MKQLLLSILAAAIYLTGISQASASGSWIDESLPPNEARMLVVSQELDQVETSFIPQNPIAASYEHPPMMVTPSAVQTQSIVSHPESNIQVSAPVSVIIPKRNEFAFNSEIYVARFDQPKNLFQKGLMAGYNAQFTHRISTNPNAIINMFRLQDQWAGGKFKQDAAGGLSGIKDNTYDLRGVIGKDFYPTSKLRTTGYFGFGYRYLKDNSEGLSTVSDGFTLEGYKRYSHYYYLPLGADIVYQTSPHTSIESNLEYDYVVHGWQVDKLGVVPGFNTLVFAQNSGDGLRASLKLNVYFKHCTAFVEGFYRYWNIPQSKSKLDPTGTVSLNEPKNNTEEFGLQLGLQI